MTADFETTGLALIGTRVAIQLLVVDFGISGAPLGLDPECGLLLTLLSVTAILHFLPAEDVALLLAASVTLGGG